MAILLTPKHLIHHESGNILLYILGAIFLLGLLVVIIKGSIMPGTGIDQETLMLRASEVQNYGSELERAVAYILANNHSGTDIRFAHPDAALAYGLITNDPTRQVFSSQGGAAIYREPPSDILTTPGSWIFTGNNSLAVGCITQNCTDLIALLMNVTKDFCLKINELNNINNPSGSPPQDVGSFEYLSLFTGAFTSMGKISDTDGINTQNTKEGCVEGDVDPPAGTYHYYRVLLER